MKRPGFMNALPRAWSPHRRRRGYAGDVRLFALLSILALVTSTACDDPSKSAPSSAPAASASAPAAAATSATSPTAATAADAAATPSTPSAAAPPDAVAAQHVLVAYRGAQRAPKSVTRSKAEAKKRAEEVAAKAKAGADFTALVAEYSDDPEATSRLGSVGKFTRDKMAKPFSDAAFALAVGETSGVVETPFGFHVIKRNQ